MTKTSNTPKVALGIIAIAYVAGMAVMAAILLLPGASFERPASVQPLQSYAAKPVTYMGPPEDLVPSVVVSLASSTPLAQSVPAGTENVLFSVVKFSSIDGTTSLQSVMIASDSGVSATNLRNIRLTTRTGVVLGTAAQLNPVPGAAGKYAANVSLKPAWSIPGNTVDELQIRADIASTASGTVRLGVTSVTPTDDRVQVQMPIGGIFGSPVTILSAAGTRRSR